MMKIKTLKYHLLKVFSVSAIILLTGCNSAPTRDPQFSAVRPVLPLPVPQAEPTGSIYQAPPAIRRVSDVALFRDSRARNIGDILTITLNESTDASKTGETVIEQTTDSSVTNPTLFGVKPSVRAPGFLEKLSSTILDDHLTTSPTGGRYTLDSSLASDKNFDGKGESSQTNSLTGQITVSVAEVLSNGYLVVRGEKLYTLNRGHEHLRFSGIVRPQDIASDNTVQSTRVANAQIVYSGEGEVAGGSSMGWLSRFFLSAFIPL